MCPSPKLIVKNSMNYFKKRIENSKYLNEKEFLKISARYTFNGNNSIVVEQSRNH